MPIKQAKIYFKDKDLDKQYKQEKPKKQEAFHQEHYTELALYEAAERYLKQHMNGHTAIPLNAWQSEVTKLTDEIDKLYQQYCRLKEEVSEVEIIQKNIEQVLHEDEPKIKINKDLSL